LYALSEIWSDKSRYNRICYAFNWCDVRLLIYYISCVVLSFPDLSDHPTHHKYRSFASPEIVSILLENGANPFDVEINGNDAFMVAAMLGREHNVATWLKRFPDWNVDRTNKTFGATALIAMLYMKPNIKITKLLLKYGANLRARNFNGTHPLISLCYSEDCDIEVLRMLLEKLKYEDVNYRLKAKSFKWRMLGKLSRFLHKTNLSTSQLVENIASDRGSSALLTTLSLEVIWMRRDFYYLMVLIVISKTE